MPKDTWTEDRIAELKRLHAEGYSFSIIAERLGVTRNAIVGKVFRLDLRPPLVPRTCKENRGNSSGIPAVRKAKAPKRERPVKFESVRAVRANGTSDVMRLIRSIATTPYQPRCVEIVPLHVSLTDLTLTDCRYPYGEDEITFCGHHVRDGSSYCAAHHELCHDKPRIPIHRFAGVAA